MDIMIRGNSLARELEETRGVRVYATGGITLREARADRGTTLFLFRTSDLWVRRERFVDQKRMEALGRVVSGVRGQDQWVLGPIIPLRDSTRDELRHIHKLKLRAATINEWNGNTAPGWLTYMCYKEAGELTTKSENYRNNVHWNRRAAEIALDKVMG